MRVYRYMSTREFRDMLAGCDIIGHSHNARTTSSGVCFLPMVVDYTDGEKRRACSARYAYNFMRGIVSDDVLVEFESPKGMLFDTEGVYANPHTCGWFDRIIVHELCIPSYNRDNIIPLRYCVPCEWEWYNVN